ncbi:MAG: hypothetical protein FJ246_11285, partial [Nitrospira sp.]|nr:hypothetical protein [Nitrospira sp.]
MLLMRILLLPLTVSMLLWGDPLSSQAQQNKPPAPPSADSASGKPDGPEQGNGQAAPESLYVSPEADDRLVILPE